MMMRYAPFTSALCDQHGEARWAGSRFALYHPGKRVKASDDDSTIVDYDCAAFIVCRTQPHWGGGTGSARCACSGRMGIV
jgi:hypothetical protein